MLAIDRKVEVLDGCQSPLAENILNATQPVILKGLAAQWPIVSAGLQSKEKAVEYVLKFYNGQPLTAFLGASKNNGRLFYNDDLSGFNFEPIRGKLDQILAQLFKQVARYSDSAESGRAPTCYVGSTNIDHWFPEFRQFNDLDLAVNDPLVSIWMGNQSKVAAHYDFPSNIACSVVGHRRFTLFPPDQLQNLYIGPLDFTPAGQAISLVDFDNPDYNRFPKFREALKYAQVAELEPGDAIVVPSMWWHHVESLDSFNVLVNYWWRSTPDYLGSPFDALLHALLALKDLPAEQRHAWQGLLDYYVFNADNQDLSHIPESRRGVLSCGSEATAKKLRGQLIDALRKNR